MGTENFLIENRSSEVQEQLEVIYVNQKHS